MPFSSKFFATEKTPLHTGDNFAYGSCGFLKDRFPKPEIPSHLKEVHKADLRILADLTQKLKITPKDPKLFLEKTKVKWRIYFRLEKHPTLAHEETQPTSSSAASYQT